MMFDHQCRILDHFKSMWNVQLLHNYEIKILVAGIGALNNKSSRMIGT